MNLNIQQLIQELKAARVAQGLTQRELAGQLGIPQSHLSKIEAGRVNVTLGSFVEMTRMLELEVLLVPRQHIALVKGLMTAKDTRDYAVGPAYTLDDESQDEV